MRLLPRSLAGQIALVMTAALLAASIVNFALIYSERSRAGLIEMTGPAIGRFVDIATEMSTNPPSQRAAVFGRGGVRFAVANRSQVDLRSLPRNERLERRLREAFDQSGSGVSDIRAAVAVVERPDRFRPPGGPPPRIAGRPEADSPGPAGRGTRPTMRGREVVLSAALPDGRWLNGTFFSPEPPRGEFLRLGASTLIIFLCVLGAALWVANRLSRPLRDLASAAAQVGAVGEPQEVAVNGPADVRQTQEAFNAMSRRVTQLLSEKDVMLGAIGHDLRTPLSSLRIRIESMEPESERQKAIQTVEEAAQLLEDILVLARQGHSGEAARTMDASVLVQDIVEDYVETGASVSMGPLQRAPILCRQVMFRRLLRNLIDNALTYGSSARLSVSAQEDRVVVAVEDEGPGMSQDTLSGALRPFERGEASRGRSSGGAGLGLAIADAITKSHGGTLELSNRPQGGLIVRVILPLAAIAS